MVKQGHREAAAETHGARVWRASDLMQGEGGKGASVVLLALLALVGWYHGVRPTQ